MLTDNWSMSRTPDRMIGIVGGSCSGKTTLEANLVGVLGNHLAIFPFDDMFVGMTALEGQQIEDWESPDLYRWDDYIQHLKDLKVGKSVVIAANSRESSEQGIATRTIEPKHFVVVTGFLALHKVEVRPIFDVSIFIDLPEAEILRRRRARSNPDSPWDSDDYIYGKLLPGHRRYVTPQRNFAAHRVDGEQSPDDLAEEVAAIIRGQT